MNGQEFSELLQSTQRHISAVYSGAVNGNKKEQLRSYIEQYLRQSGHTDETELKELTDRLYSEMAEYSVLRNTAVSIRVTQNSARKKEVKIQHGSRIRALVIILSENGSDRQMPRRRQSRERR